MTANDASYCVLPCDTNQALGIGRYAIDFIEGKFPPPPPAVVARLEQFYADSVACAVAALALKLPAPSLLREEALEHPASGTAASASTSASTSAPGGACCFGDPQPVLPGKAVAANCSAVRELDSNGTNFGYNPRTGYTRGEFGHNDFYPVAVAAAQVAGSDGQRLMRAMLCLDEIRGRLAEVFALKDHRIDHVLHGAIASAAVYGAMCGATAQQIESAIGITVAHYVPFRAIRAGHQLSDSKGASAAISSEAAVLSMQRAMRGFAGPADIFRNPQAVFCLFEPPESKGCSPFDLELATSGDDFAVMGMHFKIGVYEHQSAGAIQATLDLLAAHPQLIEDPAAIQSIRIEIYEPALGIIGDPAKRDPRTRQSADHSMVYIIGTLLRKAHQLRNLPADLWSGLMLMPEDYNDEALFDPLTRDLMQRIEFVHGGPDYDAKYPDGIPTSVHIQHAVIGQVSSPLVMYPAGHARYQHADGKQAASDRLNQLLREKFDRFTSGRVENTGDLLQRVTGLCGKTATGVRDMLSFKLEATPPDPTL